MIKKEYNGYYIQIGKNQTENDILIRSSNPEDYWVHAHGYPSGHAIISNPLNKRVPLKIIKRACFLIRSNSHTLKRIHPLKFDYTRRINVQPTHIVGKVLVSKYSVVSM